MRTARRRPTVVPTIALVLLLAVCSHRAAAVDAPPLSAWAPCPWGSDDCNVCVPDATDAINRLRSHGDIMGFHMNGAPDVSFGDHWQGVQRLMGGGGRYLAVSRLLESENQDVSFVVVEMGSRNDRGERFRSNRLDPDRFFENTPPPLEDGIAVTVPHEAGYRHAGGMQALGNILAVPFEQGDLPSKVVLYDLAKPLNPMRLANEIAHAVEGGVSTEAGTASLGKLADGRFVLVIGRGDANILDFYVSTGTDLRTTTFERFDTWNEDEILTELCTPPFCRCHVSPPEGGDCEFGNYQNLNFVHQCDGTLYLVGIHANSLIGLGEDFADLYRVENGSGNEVTITKVNKKHLFCSYRGFTHCEGDAAGGVYVDPAGQLSLYLTEHDNDGPIEGSPPVPQSPACSGPLCSVKFEEFRPVPHASCDRIRNAWVELYDDNTFGDRSLMIDFVDRDLERYTNYDHVEGFEDKGSSVRWCIPPGATYRLWEDKEPCSGSHLDLVGSGQFEEIGDLDDVSFGDDTSCSQWLGGPFADAGDDRTVECAFPFGTPLQLDGTGSAVLESGSPMFLWEAPGITFDDPTSPTPIGAFPKGTTTVTLTVSDGVVAVVDTVDVRVVDTAPPGGPCDLPLTLQRARIRGGSSTRGTITARGDVPLGRASPDSFDPSQGVVIQVLDGVTLDRTFVFAASDCRRFADGRVSCRTQNGLRVQFEPINRLGTAFDLRFQRLQLTKPFGPPFILVITTDPPDPSIGTNRVGITQECRTTPNGLVCP